MSECRDFRKESRELLVKMTKTFGMNPELALKLLKRLERQNFDNGKAPKRIVAGICWTLACEKMRHGDKQRRVKKMLVSELMVSQATMHLHKKIIMNLCGDIIEGKR